MKRRWVTMLAVMAACGVGLLPGAAIAAEALPTKSDEGCLECRQNGEEAGLLYGNLINVSQKAKTIELQIGKEKEILYFDDSTPVINAPSINEILEGEPVKILYHKKGGKIFAKEVEVKRGLKVSRDQIASLDEVAKLVALGPVKGKYVMLDGRPMDWYNAGHIPTAKGMPLWVFDDLKNDMLPRDKNILQIYYCAGFGCVNAPLSARKAEKLGYKNVKVFDAGLPAWNKAGHLVVSNIANIERLNKLEAPYILLDIRPKTQISKGHIPQAVAVADGKADALKAQFPSFKGATIILYNQDGNLDAAAAPFKTIARWGYSQVSILDGGFAAWKKAGKEIAKGPAASEIKYARKLLPGEIEVAEFKALMEKPSKDKMVLDVRGEAEVKEEGALPRAINVPMDILETHLAELPRDKTIVVHGKTGCRAEMCYNLLKNSGLKAQYLKATTEFDRETKGQLKIIE